MEIWLYFLIMYKMCFVFPFLTVSYPIPNPKQNKKQKKGETFKLYFVTIMYLCLLGIFKTCNNILC